MSSKEEKPIVVTNCLKEQLRNLLLSSGACAVGFAAADVVDDSVKKDYNDWIEEGNNAGMCYLANHATLRFDPTELLPGAKTVISLAYNYYPCTQPPEGIALYAAGKDYHKVLRKRLKPICRKIEEQYKATTRICIDSAPIAERYWAVKAGVGVIGRNGAIIVKGVGSNVFLAEILTTLSIDPDEEAHGGCRECGLCEAACPTGALSYGKIDARRCLSYLTIEHRGKFPDGTNLHGVIFGCDRCLRVCPHNAHPRPSPIAEFQCSEHIRQLDRLGLLQLDEDGFNALFAQSPIKRCGLEGLMRNLSAAIEPISRHTR